MEKLEKHIIQELKITILQSRHQAARLVNKELIILYFKIGKKIRANTKKMAWGSKVLEQISLDLQNELPGLRGFSATNLKRMTSFYEFWVEYLSISPTLSDQLQNDEISIRPTLSDEFAQAFFSVSFSHHYLIASKTETIEEAQFYIHKILSELWSYRALQYQIDSRLYHQQGALPNNFDQILPKSSSNKAMQMFKDEYLLDFINIEDPDEENERLIENEIVRNIKKFILALGTNFAFMGNQYRLMIEEQEYFIDLLFYNRKLQCLVAFELKKGKFKPEYLGKMNFYLSALDDTIKQPHENSSVGIVLCKEKNNKVVEYSFRDFNKAMGVATYITSKEIPEKYKNALPDAETLKKIMS